MNDPVKTRTELLEKLNATTYDLLIIGGGITGAGIALDAALRGLKTALIEKHDFASGTSSRSTKLIHGGLRYLKQFEFALVKEVGTERAIVHKLAPHLTVSEKMLLPLKEGRGLGTTITSFGLKLYDWLAGVQPMDQRKMLTRKKTLELEPLLKPDGVKGGGLYAEYRTDDARLTLEILKTAQHHGADVANYLKSNGFMYDNGRIQGVLAIDGQRDSPLIIKAKAVVNATGPWVDKLRLLDNSIKGKKLHLTKGVHIVVPRNRFPLAQSIYFDVPDGRMIFAIPRGGTTYIGTTDTDYKGNLDQVFTTLEDARYLMDAVNDSFPTVNLELNDIISSWAGLRPLIHEAGRSASELSRKDEIFESSTGLLSIAGGKLTGYRKMAERVVDMVIDRHFKNRKIKPCATAQTQLMGGEFKSAREVELYHQALTETLISFRLEQHTHYLVHTYGKQCDTIVDYLRTVHDENPEISLGKAELWFTIHYEMVCTPLDFFNRRTGMLYFDIYRMQNLVEPLLQDFKRHFNWPEERVVEERLNLEEAIRQAQLK
jgi:glycerol-3-phosphate dehydrogenase